MGGVGRGGKVEGEEGWGDIGGRWWVRGGGGGVGGWGGAEGNVGEGGSRVDR